MSRKPDFFIVGAPKSGTTSLYYYLDQHPGIFLSEPKEPRFFHDRCSPGEPVLEKKDPKEYLKLFEGVPGDVRAGEASTSYLYVANAAREIREFQPEAKIMMVLRDPVDRAYSQYWHHVRDGIEPLSFEEALEAEPERIREKRPVGFYYVESGRYAGQVARYLEAFGRNPVRVYLFEDLKEDAGGVVRDIFSFLGVDAGCPVEVGRAYNRSGLPRSALLSGLTFRLRKNRIVRALPTGLRRGAKEWLLKKNVKPAPKMNPRTRSRLRELYREDIRRLEGLIGRDLSHWLE